jgi:serine/threonine protein kinase
VRRLSYRSGQEADHFGSAALSCTFADDGPVTKILAIPGEGERLDRFELVAELASGGMATVYLARFVGMAGFKRFVAIKRLHPHLAKEHDFIQMFLDEARLAARLHHPNVVPILEIGVQQNQQYYLVMEYIEGDTAGHLLGRAAHVNRKIPVAVAIRIMLDALTGLHAAHELADEDGTPLDIVHRDVSPQNILVGVDGVARITDFGVAKAATRLANATQSGQLKGKLAYMSPEQVRGNLPVDRRADVFAAGIVLWEMLTGYRLFKAEGEAETLFKVVAAEVPSIRAYEPSVPPEVEVVVMRALAREADQRFRTAADFAEALEQAARVYDLVATVRATAGFVNEMIGVDISQQRDIVRAWLARSDVSRSGVARSAALAQAGIPDVAPAPQSAPQPELSSLVDDDLEMATRVDDPEPEEDPNDATRIQPQLQAAASGPVLSVGRSQDPAYLSYPTSREFQPMASSNPALANTLSSPTTSPVTPGASGPWQQQPGASGPWQQQPPGVSGPWQQPPGVSGPWQQQPGVSGPWPQAAPAARRKTLPLWTMAIPAVIIIGGAVLLALHARSVQAPAPRAPATSAAPAATQPPQTSPQPAQPEPSASPSTVAAPPETSSAQPPPVAAPPPTTTPPEPAAAETATHAAEPVTHTAPPPPPHVVRHGPVRKNPAAIDNKEFGGRE